MTKEEVVKRLREKTGLSHNQSTGALELFLESAKEALQRGEKVCLVGFGTFRVKKKNARKCRNPRTGKRVNIPEKRVVVFKPGKAFRELVNRT